MNRDIRNRVGFQGELAELGGVGQEVWFQPLEGWPVAQAGQREYHSPMDAVMVQGGNV